MRAGSGPFSAIARFAGRTTATLSLVDASGGVISRVRGRSPLRVAANVDAATLSLILEGPRGLRFRIAIKHPATVPAPAVALSEVPDLPPAEGTVGPQLGRLAVGNEPLLALGVRVSEEESTEPPILRAINALRRRSGLRALRLSRPLAAAGDAHARALAATGQFTHDWPDGRRFDSWIPRYFRGGSRREWSVGENLLWTDGTLDAEQVVEAWLDSPGHRRILLTPGWRELGVGVVRAVGAGGVYGGRNVYVVAAEFGVR